MLRLKRHLGPGSLVISDGLKCFRAVERATCNHLGFTMGGRLELLDHAAFRWVNTMLGNIKTRFTGAAISLARGTFPAISLNTASASTIALTLAACSPSLGLLRRSRRLCHTACWLAEDHG